MLLKLHSNRRYFWYALFVFGLIAVVMTWVLGFASNSDHRYINNDGEIIGKPWYDKLITPFYFTYVSNLMGFLIALIWVFKLIKNRKIKKQIEVLATVNLSVTLIVYWALLFPLGQPENALGWINNLNVHLIVPLLSIFVYVLENVVAKNKIFMVTWKHSLFNLLFPLIWLAIAMIIYVSLNCDPGAAIYPFLDVAHNPAWMTVVTFIGIAGCYFGLTWLYLWLGNPNTKKKIKQEPSPNLK